MATINDILLSQQGNNGSLGGGNNQYALEQWLRSPEGRAAIQQQMSQFANPNYAGGMTRGDDAQTAYTGGNGTIQTPYGPLSMYTDAQGGGTLSTGTQKYDWGGGLAEGGNYKYNPDGTISYGGAVDSTGGVDSTDYFKTFAALAGAGSAAGMYGGGAAAGSTAGGTAGGVGGAGGGGMAMGGATTLRALEGGSDAVYNGTSAAGGGGGFNWGALGGALTSPAGIGTIASLLGGWQQSQAADRASQAQLEAAKMAQAEIARQFDQNRADQAPWREAGANTLGQLMSRLPELTAKYDPSQLQSDPGYQFGLTQGTNAIGAQQRALGLSNSGATLKALTRYGQDYAGTKYNEAFNRDQVQKNSIYNMLAGISGTGQTAANQIASQGTNASNNIAGLMTQAGNARAAGTVGSANAWTNAANNIGQLWADQGYSNIYGR